MENLKILIWVLTLTHSVQLRAEDMPTMPIAFFAVKSSEIWEAEPLEQNTVASSFWQSRYEGDNFVRVRISKIYRSLSHKTGDTVYVNFGSVYDWPSPSETNHEWRLSAHDTLQRIWLFGDMITQTESRSYGRQPVLSGAPYLQVESSGIWPENQKTVVFRPFQMDNPGPYVFSRSKFTGTEMDICVTRNVHLADELFSIRKIGNRIEQNDSLFSWVKRNQADLRLKDFSHPNSWMWHRELPFSWILNNGIDNQAWEAIELYHQFFPEDLLHDSDYSYALSAQQNQFERALEKHPPFQSQKGIAFLLGKMRDISLSLPLRNNAMYWFREAVRGDLTFENRKTTLRDLFQMPAGDSILSRHEWVETIQSVGFWQENYLNRSLPEAYQFLARIYQNEPPEANRNRYADFLVRHSTAEEWKKLNGSDARILVEYNNFWIDTLKRTLTFQIHQAHGYEFIFECPQMEMFQLDPQGQRINVRAFSGSDICTKVDWTNRPLSGELCVKIQMDENSPRGRWYFKAWGNAGQKHELQWVSELGSCWY